MITVAYKPHLGFCPSFFQVQVENRQQAVRVALCLALYQSFLGVHNHSQKPKSRLEFLNAQGKPLGDMQGLINSVNQHRYMNLDGFDAIANDADVDKHKLRLYWFPQIGHRSFKFPIFDEDEAAILLDALAHFDLYLLEVCDNMRTDYANTGGLQMIDPDWEPSLDTTDKFIEWEKDTDGEYFDDVQAYVQHKNRQAA